MCTQLLLDTLCGAACSSAQTTASAEACNINISDGTRYYICLAGTAAGGCTGARILWQRLHIVLRAWLSCNAFGLKFLKHCKHVQDVSAMVDTDGYAFDSVSTDLFFLKSIDSGGIEAL